MSHSGGKNTSAASGLWARLRQNEEENAPRFTQAGISRNRVRMVQCGHCNNAEEATFWTPLKVSGDTLHLGCPACDRSSIRYSLSQNRVRAGERSVRAPHVGIAFTAAIMTFAALVLAFAPTEQLEVRTVQTLIHDGLGWGPKSWAPSVTEGSTGGARQSMNITSFAPRLQGRSRSEGGLKVYTAPGDRSTKVEQLVNEAVQAEGLNAKDVIQSSLYIDELDLTRVIVDVRSPAWKTYYSKHFEDWETPQQV